MKVAVVIPSYKVKSKITNVISRITPVVDTIYVVDDCCPEDSGKHVLSTCQDPRVKVLFHEHNLGVGGAVITGYRQAISDKCDVAVKIDGDGQMDPELIESFIKPIIQGHAAYSKGNRFHNIDDCKRMPAVRILGNATLSFFSKMSSGYWNIFDPTNGYTAISLETLSRVPLSKLSNRYFFESDLLFRLSVANARVIDIPMTAIYEDEVSNLKIHKILFPFLTGHLKNFSKRIFYNYFLRDFSPASLELILGLALLVFGISFGLYKWITLYITDTVATSGTVMLAALPTILGTQLLLSFLNHDIQMNNFRQKQ